MCLILSQSLCLQTANKGPDKQYFLPKILIYIKTVLLHTHNNYSLLSRGLSKDSDVTIDTSGLCHEDKFPMVWLIICW